MREMAKMEEENVYSNVPERTGRYKGLKPVRGPQRRSKVTVERVALVVLSVLLVAAVAALIGVSISFRCLSEDKPGATEATTETVQYTTQTKETVTTIAPPVCTFSNNVPSCGEDWELHGTNCYYFSPISAKMPWNESRAMCQWLKGDLVKIESREEQEFLETKLQTVMYDHWDRFWIGLTDFESEGQWVWTDGSALNPRVVFWTDDGYNKEPDNWKAEDPEGENCVRMGRKPNVGEPKCWYDRSCKKRERSICEKTAKSV